VEAAREVWQRERLWGGGPSALKTARSTTTLTTTIGVLSQEVPAPATRARLDREHLEAELSATLQWRSNARRNSIRLVHSAVAETGELLPPQRAGA